MTRIRIVANPQPQANRAAEPQIRPLSHHEVLAFMAPFTRRGRHADLAASRREDRRIVFRPIEHPPPGGGLPEVRERLALEVPERGDYRLVRTLTCPGVGEATLTAKGPDPGDLLEQIERFPVERQARLCAGVPVMRSYRLERTRGSGPWLAVLTEARAEVRGAALEVNAELDRSAQLRLTAPAGERLQIPGDLLAVLGWHWRPLEDYTSHWRGSIRLKAKGRKRAAEIEEKLGLTIAHLVATLSEPPVVFHPRHRRARWRVMLQRATPLLAALGLIAVTPAVGLLPMDEGTLLRMLIFHAPPLLLIGFFLFGELPRFEIPPPPRRLKQPAWLAPSPR
jgi:hypothetical protein